MKLQLGEANLYARRPEFQPQQAAEQLPEWRFRGNQRDNDELHKNKLGRTNAMAFATGKGKVRGETMCLCVRNNLRLTGSRNSRN